MLCFLCTIYLLYTYFIVLLIFMIAKAKILKSNLLFKLKLTLLNIFTVLSFNIVTSHDDHCTI